MLAAGTGIAPMIPIIRCILDNQDDMTFVHLVYCCRTYEDILCKAQLDSWADYWNFNCKYVLSKVSVVIAYDFDEHYQILPWSRCLMYELHLHLFASLRSPTGHLK